MLATVRRTIRRHEMLPPGGRVVCALSGGADSVALLHILLELQALGELTVAAAAHFNHRLRGDAADEDERFCRELAASLGVAFESGSGDVRARATAAKRSIEDAARAARYEFLTDTARRLQADAVAVGHTLDDQAETFLLRLIRGAGTRGLGAIRPKAGMIIRPLLDVRRADLRRCLTMLKTPYREDASNMDVAIPRNRVRHELIPCLERDFSPGIVEVLAREAASAQEDEDRLHAEAIDLASSIVLTESPVKLTVAGGPLTALHPALASRVAREALRRLSGDRFVGFDHVKRFLEFCATAPKGSCLSLPGQQARVMARSRGAGGRTIELRPEPARIQRVATRPPRAGTRSAFRDGQRR